MNHTELVNLANFIDILNESSVEKDVYFFDAALAVGEQTVRISWDANEGEYVVTPNV